MNGQFLLEGGPTCDNGAGSTRCGRAADGSDGRRGANRHSPCHVARQRVARVMLLCSCIFISLSAKCIVEASSSSGNGGNAPFMVMSEITVPSDEAAATDAGESYILAGDDRRGGDAIAEGGDSSADANDEEAVETSPSSAETDVDGGDSMMAGSGGSGSDTDGEDDNELNSEIGGETEESLPPPPLVPPSAVASESAAASPDSQPLRTLTRLQAMLDDSDYATQTVASASVVGSTAAIGGDMEPPVEQPQTQAASNANRPPAPPPDKLWTSKDRAKYRRTRRTEKLRQQQQQQREYEEQRARKIRDIQRERIIRDERERKDLEEVRRKRAEAMERQRYDHQQQQHQQQQFLHLEEATDFTDGEDTDGRGFELPDLPVYLSDGETDDFSEEADDSQRMQRSQPRQPPQGYRMPHQTMGQTVPQPDQYNYPAMQQSPPPQRQPPPQANGPYHNIQRYPPFAQQQQQPPPPPQTMPPYQFDPNNQQMQREQSRQYAQQYTAWAQAAANGYHYPPPPPPGTAAYQNQQQAQPAPQPEAYTQQYPYATQQHPNQQSSYGGAHPQQSYPPQQQGAFAVPLGRASYPPGSRASQATSAHPGRGFFGREREAGSMGRPEQSQPIASAPNDAKVEPRWTDHSMVDQVKLREAEPTLNRTATSTNGQMAVKSALVAPTSPLITPLSSRSDALVSAEGPYCDLVDETAVLIAGAESKISFDSMQKLAFSTVGVALLSYGAVSPRSLPFPEYNRLFLQNLSIVWLAAITPLLSLFSVYDAKFNNINTAIGTFHVSFTLGYALALLSEIVVTTAVRLGVFRIWEPAIFSLTPAVPSIILPWVLREKQYKPKRITLFAADFAASCVASPIIEEYLKLKIVEWTCKLPRNFKQIRKVQKQKRRRRKKQTSLQPVRSLDAPQVTNINCYVTQMLAASLGLKLFDITRRILMYTKESDSYKRVYAVCRGTFPIHELCGTMTALLLARRDVLGIDLPTWKILGPAVFIHGMANFRGMKPIFKWNSSTPWSEMQINQLKKGDVVWRQLLPKSYAKLVWLTILCRVAGFCVKNYYLIGRQAKKRTTTYSGKLYAFNAKLQTDAMLKRSTK